MHYAHYVRIVHATFTAYLMNIKPHQYVDQIEYVTCRIPELDFQAWARTLVLSCVAVGVSAFISQWDLDYGVSDLAQYSVQAFFALWFGLIVRDVCMLEA